MLTFYVCMVVPLYLPCATQSYHAILVDSPWFCHGMPILSGYVLSCTWFPYIIYGHMQSLPTPIIPCFEHMCTYMALNKITLPLLKACSVFGFIIHITLIWISLSTVSLIIRVCCHCFNYSSKCMNELEVLDSTYMCVNLPHMLPFL